MSKKDLRRQQNGRTFLSKIQKREPKRFLFKFQKSEFEAEAYCEYLNACSQFEKEDWEQALNFYIKGNL